MGLVWLVLSTLLVAAGIRARLRQRSAFDAAPPKLDDDAVRSIEERGALRLDRDAPLDLDEIGKEEERFWSETWPDSSEEPEEL